MAIDIRSFKPIPHSSSATAVTAASQKVLLVKQTETATYVRVYNGSTAVVYIEFGDATVVASATTSLALAPGEIEIFSIGAPSNPVYAAFIGTATSGNISISTGIGI